jgi:DNA-binding response OmpR family regulator
MLRLLLAEDNPGDVGLVREALRTSPVPTQLVVAFDGAQALSYLRGSQFDLAILDLNLPKADGHAILQHYGRADGAPAIVVFSSSLRHTDRELAVAAGAKEYVVKPTNLDEFIHAVQGIIERWNNPERPGDRS